MARSEIKISNCQVKSLSQAQRLCKHLSVIEEEIGIKEVRISFDKMFICPWIDLDKLDKTPMEELVSGIFKRIS